ncbi:MAG: FAD-dependent oxidoreductase, partial [SAR202 cluster bacterium]|nr:FAD-dependent oxidoreductase [SAR202 cluster bacterium]
MVDVTIIGGGIVGLAAAHELLKQKPSLKVILLEKEPQVGQHQTGHNSGVIHSGIYYKPGSLKAINCRRGIELLLEFCNHYDIFYDMCGKVIVATTEEELNTLGMLHVRGRENGISGLKMLSAPELLEYEPHAAGLSALYCP